MLRRKFVFLMQKQVRNRVTTRIPMDRIFPEFHLNLLFPYRVPFFILVFLVS